MAISRGPASTQIRAQQTRKDALNQTRTNPKTPEVTAGRGNFPVRVERSSILAYPQFKAIGPHQGGSSSASTALNSSGLGFGRLNWVLVSQLWVREKGPTPKKITFGLESRMEGRSGWKDVPNEKPFRLAAEVGGDCKQQSLQIQRPSSQKSQTLRF